MSNNNWQEEAMRRLRQMQQARGGAGGGPPQIPKGSPALLAAGIALVGGAYIFSNSLFNVDGGQRAIKYRRLNGVSKEIYSEGELFGGITAIACDVQKQRWFDTLG